MVLKNSVSYNWTKFIFSVLKLVKMMICCWEIPFIRVNYKIFGVFLAWMKVIFWWERRYSDPVETVTKQSTARPKTTSKTPAPNSNMTPSTRSSTRSQALVYSIGTSEAQHEFKEMRYQDVVHGRRLSPRITRIRRRIIPGRFRVYLEYARES